MSTGSPRRNSLSITHQVRGLSFIRVGMRVEVQGQTGIVKGESQGYLSVLMLGDTSTSNVHPTWETVYYADDGSVVMDYRKQRAAS